ncbi:MAG: hypothetical protein DMF86_02800 [Acidobacteria bacterium]|nr:MAG: hypothetical protein DMF86_02800 [Acidobacteriota bacterium]
MPRRLTSIVRRTAVVVLLLAILAAGIGLPFAGRFLAAEDPLARADAIMVLDGAHAERWLEAVDLYRAGMAPSIVLSSGRREPAELYLERLGIHYPINSELARDTMVRMGIPANAITLTGGALDNTAQEAVAVRADALARGWRRLIVVTSKYHCRRARLAFRREFAATGIDIAVHGSRYDASDPARWWRSRVDVRFVASELPRFVLYRLGLGA